jgi:heat shock protein HslJ
VSLGCKSTPSESASSRKPGGSSETTGTPLEGTTWRLVEIDGQAVAPGATAEPPRIHLDATSKAVTGSTGCNSLTGIYKLEGAKLTFGPLAMTLRACMKGMEFETAMGKALAMVNGYELSGSKLTLTGDGSVVARFEAASP